MACKPTLALVTLSKAMEAWMDDVDASLRSVSKEVARSSPVHELRLTSAFLGEASLNIIRLVAGFMLSSITAKRALWLLPWLANPAFEQAWCRIPFEGSSLFGNKLDNAITHATGGKSGFLPQNHCLLGQKRAQPRQGSDRARDAHRYIRAMSSGRPGRETSHQAKSFQRERLPGDEKQVGARLLRFRHIWAASIKDYWTVKTVFSGHAWAFSSPPTLWFVHTSFPHLKEKKQVLLS